MSATAGFRSLFDGKTLAGWRPIPRVYGSAWPGAAPPAVDASSPSLRFPATWNVVDGAIVGRQNAEVEGYGGYLLSEESFGDFELVLEVNPDWPVDTGIMLRRGETTWNGFQVLIDHRDEGSIGGFYGNGLDDFHAVPFTLGPQFDDAGAQVGLAEFGAARTPALVGFTPEKRAMLSHAAEASEFLGVWRFRDWNEIRVRCVGSLPVLTTWVNGVRIAELDTSAINRPNYDPDAVLAHLGPRGHLALEVHDRILGAGDLFWGPGAVCRWRGIRIREL